MEELLPLQQSFSCALGDWKAPGTDGQGDSTATSLLPQGTPGKAKPGGSQDAELCWAQSPSLRELLCRNRHILCLSWLYPSGASSGGASELGNTNNAEWDIQGP